MKKVSIILSSILLLCSCVTSELVNPIEPDGQGYYNDENISIGLVLDGKINKIHLDLAFTNKSSEMIYIDLDKSALSTSGYTQRIVNGNTRKIDANKAQVLIPVAPGSYATISVYDPDGNGLFIDSESILTICYLQNNEDEYATLNLQQCNNIDSIGKVNISGTNWKWFFTGKDTEAKMHEALMNEAIALYGSDIELANIHYSYGWSPLSLVMYLDIFGYVDFYEASADVIEVKRTN